MIRDGKPVVEEVLKNNNMLLKVLHLKYYQTGSINELSTNFTESISAPRVGILLLLRYTLPHT